MIANTINAYNVDAGDKANTTPNSVATPLPPLNFAKTGNMCPVTANSPKIILVSSGYCVSIPNNEYNFTAKNPFKESIIKTIMAALNPNNLNVFVAPAFPLPCSLMSIPLYNLPAITAVGMEPKR